MKVAWLTDIQLNRKNSSELAPGLPPEGRVRETIGFSNTEFHRSLGSNAANLLEGKPNGLLKSSYNRNRIPRSLLRGAFIFLNDEQMDGFLKTLLKDRMHFLIQPVPMYSAKRIVQTVKSITAREILKGCPEVKEKLWGGEFWSDGYFVNTVGQCGNEDTIQQYIHGQGKEYQKIHQQLMLF